MGERKEYHYGQTIKEYRVRCGMTQARLAELWPRRYGEEGTSVRYIHDIEHGVKKIADPAKLRRLAELLSIPLWKFGLSEYDPFNPTILPGSGQHLYDETLDVVETLIKQTLGMRSVATVPQVEKAEKSCSRLFAYFIEHTPPSSQLKPRFVTLYAHALELKSLMHFEHKQYGKALEIDYEIYDLAKQSQDPALMVLALNKIGIELNRKDEKDNAVNALEEARDWSFQCSKQIAAWNLAYLGHIYAAAGDALRFQHSMDAAQRIAEPLGERYGDGTDFIFHKQSGILHLRSRGYLRIKEPKKVLELHEIVRRQVAADANVWLDFRLHLYRANAYLMLSEVEDCIGAAREFLHSVKDWKSPHRLGKGMELLKDIDRAGYGKVGVVDEFRKELETAVQQQSSHNPS